MDEMAAAVAVAASATAEAASAAAMLAAGGTTGHDAIICKLERGREGGGVLLGSRKKRGLDSFRLSHRARLKALESQFMVKILSCVSLTSSLSLKILAGSDSKSEVKI